MIHKYIYVCLLILLCQNVFCQDEISTNATFNYLYEQGQPQYRDLRLNSNQHLRVRYKVKSIIRKLILQPNPYGDSLIKLDAGLHFYEAHTAIAQYYSYTSFGLLAASSVVPLYIKTSAKDSANFKYVKIEEDKANDLYIINYYRQGIFINKEIFKNNNLVETQQYETYNLSEDKSVGNITVSCELILKCKYDSKNRLISRKYNNPNYFTKTPSNNCNIWETETYTYKKSEITITKIPFQPDSTYSNVYINEIKFNKNNQMANTSFYGYSDKAFYKMFTCLYDKKKNLNSIYESFDPKEPMQDRISYFKNIYDNEGFLYCIIEPHFSAEDLKIFFFDRKGLLTKIDYEGQDCNAIELFDYTFYK